MIKNFIKYCLIIPLFIWSIWSICLWLWYDSPDVPFPYKDKDVDALDCDENTDLWNCTSIKEDEKNLWNDTIIRKLLWIFGLNTDKWNDLKFIDYAKAVVNIALALTALIALIMTIYTFYMVIFSENEAWIKKAKWNLIGIFIALGIIWFAWLIVSLIFRWYQSNWKRHQDEITWNISMTMDGYINDQIYLTI